MSEKKNNQKRFLMVIAIFVLPVLLAKIALETGFFNRGATNKGQLLDPVLNLTSVYQTDDPKWRLLYVLPQNCTEPCKNALYSLNQIWLAMGKHMDRVRPVLLVPDQESTDFSQLQEQYQNIKMLTVSQQSVNKVFKDVGSDGIFIVDTLDNIILRYPLQQKQQQAVLYSREILADLRKLLKLSRIG